MARSNPINLKAYIRALIAIALIALWSLAALTGVLLWLAPSGPRSGWRVLFLELTKHQWGEIHFWISVGALGVTVVHVLIDRKALRACMRYLTSTRRRAGVGEHTAATKD